MIHINRVSPNQHAQHDGSICLIRNYSKSKKKSLWISIQNKNILTRKRAAVYLHNARFDFCYVNNQPDDWFIIIAI